MTMRNYIQNLRKVSEEQRAELELRSSQPSVEWEPLEVQINSWWSSLPPVLQLRNYQITEIAAQCKGRYRAKPALRQVATSLRALGWTQKRDWSAVGRNRRYWTNSPLTEKTIEGIRTKEVVDQKPIDSRYA